MILIAIMPGYMSFAISGFILAPLVPTLPEQLIFSFKFMQRLSSGSTVIATTDSTLGVNYVMIKWGYSL